MTISSYWWNPRWQERHTLRTALDPVACTEAIDRNVGFFSPVAFDWFWPGRRRRFFKYTPLVGRGSRTWGFLNISPTRDGSEVTVRFALHPADVAQIVLIAAIYGVFMLFVALTGSAAIAHGARLTFGDTLFVLATFVGFPVASAGIYLSLRFIARKDGPFMLSVFKQILQAQEVTVEPRQESRMAK